MTEAEKIAKEMCQDLIKWLARAKLSGHYDKEGLHSFADAARAVLSKLPRD